MQIHLCKRSIHFGTLLPNSVDQIAVNQKDETEPSDLYKTVN